MGSVKVFDDISLQIPLNRPSHCTRFVVQCIAAFLGGVIINRKVLFVAVMLIIEKLFINVLLVGVLR